MDKKAIYAIVAAAVIIVAAVGVYWFVTNDDKDEKDPNEITFLVGDDKGNYFWMTGSGEKAIDAFRNAAEKCNVEQQTPETSWGASINSIAGLAATEDFSKYWATFVYSDGKWVISDDGLSMMNSADHKYIALFYVTNVYPENPAVPSDTPDVKDAKDTDGYKFPA